MVGEMICGKPLDKFGEVLMCAPLPFDSWRTRHDKIKILIQQIGNECGAVVDCEPYGLFSAMIPSVALESSGLLSTFRERQGLVPDFLLSFPAHHDPFAAQLAELKLLSAGATWYHGEEKTVDKRARLLPNEYRSKLKTIEKKYMNSNDNEPGILQQKLDSYGNLRGLVMGQFGEGSQDLHDLLQQFATEKTEKIRRSSGRPLGEHERGLILQQLRRRLSVAAIRAQSCCLLSRLGHTGVGARRAAKRCSSDKRRQEDQNRELRCHWEAHIRGRRLQRLGSLHH